jgi:hypothetical protein
LLFAGRDLGDGSIVEYAIDVRRGLSQLGAGSTIVETAGSS